MTLADLEIEIDGYVSASGLTNATLKLHLDGPDLLLIKYMPGSRLDETLKLNALYASESLAFTWGDAIYVAPIRNPRTTMMYGDVGVVGAFRRPSARFFDATDSIGIDLYQRWIVHQSNDYRDLTTTVHANEANRELRNNFRTRFQIDCVYFRPDESCLDYVYPSDLWFAITHWDATAVVGHGYSQAISDLKWCVVGPDSFRAEGRGYKANLHKRLSVGSKYLTGHYSSLETDIRRAYSDTGPSVVMCDFD